MLFNLLSNAIGFSAPGQTVTLAAMRRGDEIVFKVSDHGRGIPNEVLDRVFDRFESHTGGSRTRGPGLGLSIVRALVELHGGRVPINSVYGEGTTVTCVFPIEGAPRRRARRPDMAAARKASNGEAIELVDEAATATLARQLASFVQPGDFIALSGDLGAGKTAFVPAAALRALADDPELEGSPTFTLIQVYDGPGFPVVHADFYRLRGADELAQIGWDEAIDGAVTMVEWAERAESALPADRLEIALHFDPAYGPKIHHAEMRAFGALGVRWRRARAIERLLRENGWAQAERVPLAGKHRARL